MNPINFTQANILYTGEGCSDLPAFADGHEIISCWEPTEDELTLLKETLDKGEVPKIYLSLMGTVQIPVWISAGSPFTIDEKGDNNNEK